MVVGERASTVAIARGPPTEAASLVDQSDFRSRRIYRCCSMEAAVRPKVSATARLVFPAAFNSSNLRSSSSVHLVLMFLSMSGLFRCLQAWRGQPFVDVGGCLGLPSFCLQ
jgi:hypothetical protein